MKRKKDKKTATQEEPEAPAEVEAAAADEESELEKLIREREEFQNQWLRAKADCQNLRRRTLADIEAAVRRSVQPLLDDLLLVMDHLDLALSTPCTHAESKNLATGVKMIREQFDRVLEKEGVAAVTEEGSLDPRLHEVVATVTDPDRAPGTLVETIRKGYLWKEQVLRPAHVKVVAEPPQASPEGEAEESS